MRGFISYIRNTPNGSLILLIVLVALFSLVVDGRKLKDKGLIREYKLIKYMSYSYIVIAIFLSIILATG